MQLDNSPSVNCCLPHSSKCQKIQIEKRVARAKLQGESQLMKSDVVFALERAGWPALIVDGSGVIRYANKMATELFGAAVEKGVAPLSTIWLAETAQKVEEFLGRIENSPISRTGAKFRTAAGLVASYAVSTCVFSEADQKFFLLQLFREMESA